MSRLFTVVCYNRVSGKMAWSMSQETHTAAQAIAQACLPPSDRPAFVADHLNDNRDDLATDHPAYDMAGTFQVHANVWP